MRLIEILSYTEVKELFRKSETFYTIIADKNLDDLTVSDLKQLHLLMNKWASVEGMLKLLINRENKL